VASFDLCEEQDQEEKEKCTAELLESTQETLEWLRKREPDHEKLLVSLQITGPGSLPQVAGHSNEALIHNVALHRAP